MPEMLRELRARENQMVRLLGNFVRCESPSHDKAAVDRMAGILAAEWKRRGTQVRVLPQRNRGDHLRVEVWHGKGDRKSTRLNSSHH